MRFLCLVLTAGLCSSIISCKKRRVITVPAAYIIGSNDIQTLSAERRKELPPDLLYSVVLLTTKVSNNKRKFCTGTLIPAQSGEENFRVVTNHHCFAHADDDGQVNRELFPGHCSTTQVYFGFFKGNVKERKVYTCLEGSFRSDYDGDLAVFTLNENPPGPFKPGVLWSGDENADNKEAFVIHFPGMDDSSRDDQVFEPTSGISLPVGRITESNCITKGRFPPGEWHLDKSLPMGIRHTCDQLKGSSGSALWDKGTRTILGVNWGGIKLLYGGDAERTFNVATRAAYVQAFLANDLQSHNALDSVARSEPDQEENQKTKLPFCGVTGVGHSPIVWNLLPLLLPLLHHRRRRSRS